MKTKLKLISVKELDKDGNQYTDKYGNEQARVSIQIDNSAYEGKWLSAFVKTGDWVTKWTQGQDVEIDIVEKGAFTNFKPSKPASPQMIQSLQKSAGQYNAPVIRVNEGIAQPLPANEAEVMKILQAMKEQLGWMEDYVKQSRRENEKFQEELKQVLERIEFNQNPLNN